MQTDNNQENSLSSLVYIFCKQWLNEDVFIAVVIAIFKLKAIAK